MALIHPNMLAAEMPVFFTPPGKPWEHRLFKGGSAPPPPDPVATAKAQADANVQAAQQTAVINRTDSVTPFGSNTWTQSASDPNKWTQTTALSADAQKLMDQFNAANSKALPGIDLSKLPAAGSLNVSNLPGVKSLDLSGISLPSVATGAGSFSGNGGDIARSQALASGAGDVMQELLKQAKDMYSKPLSYDSLGAMPTADEATRQKIQDSLYANSARTLDPQWKQQQSDLMSSLAAQGITLGGDAYDRAYGNFARAKNDAYDQARNDSVTMSTDQMQKMFAMQMAARQEGVNEINTMYNSPMDLLGKGQGVYSGLESTLNQDYQTQINQNLAQQQIASAQNADALNAARFQASNAMAMHDASLADNQNAFNQAVQQANAQQALRTSALNEQSAANTTELNNRNNILNQLMSMSTGSQIANNAQTQIAAAPVAQSIYNSYQGQLSAYNAQMQQQNAIYGALGQLGGMATHALLM